MNRWICVFFLYFFSSQIFAEEILNDLAYSAPDQIVALSQESYKIGGIVSPLSGQPYLKQTDLIARGAQDIILQRIFIPQHREWHPKQDKQSYKEMQIPSQTFESGWVIYPHTHLDYVSVTKQKHGKSTLVKHEVRVRDPNGIALTYILDVHNNAKLIGRPFGICNCYSANETPSAQFDLRNIKLVKNKNSILLHSPQGSTYHYQMHESYSKQNSHKRTTYAHYLLSKEILPNGKILHYYYNKEKQLESIFSLDPKERYVYAKLSINCTPFKATSTFSTNSGKTASYQQQPKKLQNKSHHKVKSNVFDLLPITCVKSPFYASETISFAKSLLNHYSGRKNQFTCQYVESGNRKISKLLLLGDDADFHPVHEFSYNPPRVGKSSGSTTVKNVDGTFTIYEYSPKFLLTSIKSFDSHSVLQKQKLLDWTSNQWISSVTCQDGQGNVLYNKTYEYDAYGNPIVEVFRADLSGNGVSEIVTRRQFTKDNRHLLLEEMNQDGKVLTFTYLLNTNLITAKLTKEHDRILKREFYAYDDSHNLIRQIEDNGVNKDAENLIGVTQRKIINFTLRNQTPFLHLPEWIEEKYMEDGSEKLLKLTQLSYDTHGNVCEEKVYDANGTLAYVLHKTYNERGDVIATTNPLGQEVLYEYDEKGLCTSSLNFSKNIQTKKEYDRKGHLVKVEEIGIDQVCHSTSFFYDLNDHLIKKIDTFQNATTYNYDVISDKITATHFPPICDKNGISLPVNTTSTYDAFGREIAKTDANGHTTIYHYAGNALPVEIIYPDQSREIFRYTQTGLLETHIDREGLKISYTYDILERMLSKRFSSVDGEIAQETFEYDSFNLIKKTDREGHEIHYSYDGAGRLIKEVAYGNITTYTYDALGRIESVVNVNGDQSLFTYYKRDLIDRIIEKTCTDTSGTILSTIAYSYDADGNIASIHRSINGNEAIETFAYDSFQRQTEATDAYGNKTKTFFNERATNALGQQVLQTTICDPKNRFTIKTEDPYGRIVQEDLFNANNVLLNSQKMTYDPNGNLLQKKNLIFHGGHYLRTLETEYSYNPCNKLCQLTRAANTLNSRTTLYTYTPNGNIASRKKPDGTLLQYNYHPFGYLKNIQSSDNLLNISYERNACGDLLKATDEITKISLQRKLDQKGNVLEEKLSTGLGIKKTYDAFNRPLSIDLPDQGQILYTYDPLFLRSVSRTSSTGLTLYSHKYTKYDSSGYLQEENLLETLGTVKHATDLKGRPTAITSPYIAQACEYDESDNTTIITTNGLEDCYTYDDLDQLTNEASTSYQYDTNFNRLSENGSTWTSNELDELLSTGNVQCTYDLNGNLLAKKTSKGTTSFAYDHLDRLIKVTTNDCRIEMVYDPLGRRVSKTTHFLADSSRKTENYLFDGDNDIGAFNAEGKLVQLRTLGLAKNRHVPSAVAIELDHEVFAPVHDFQGNTRILISLLDGKQKATYSFNAFGKPKQSSETLFNPWRYASKRLDPETQLIYFGKRYYDTELCRWITTDPAGFIDGMNLYSYVKNNPFRYIDPDGRFAFAIPLITLAFGFEGVVSLITLETVGYAVLGAALGWGAYEINRSLDQEQESYYQSPVYYNEAVLEPTEAEKKKGDRKSPYGGDELGDDPTKCPGEGYTWKGRGPPGSKEGAWYNGRTKESLHPDLNHPPPKPPHWDYRNGTTEYEEELYLDGTWKRKK